MRKVELLPTRDCEAGYGSGNKPFDPESPGSELNPVIRTDCTYSVKLTWSKRNAHARTGNLKKTEVGGFRRKHCQNSIANTLKIRSFTFFRYKIG